MSDCPADGSSLMAPSPSAPSGLGLDGRPLAEDLSAGNWRTQNKTGAVSVGPGSRMFWIVGEGNLDAAAIPPESTGS